MKVRKAVILAAGFGTRMLPASKVIPKEILPVVDKPAIQMVVEEAVESGNRGDHPGAESRAHHRARTFQIGART